jgi:hypothetical protein
VSERRRPLADPEVLELLQDEPELLAIADALATTRPGYRRARPVRRPLALAAAAAVLLIGVSLASLAGRGPTLTERALAAIGNGEVVHAVLRTEVPHNVVIELATGEELPTTVEIESWFDRRLGEVRTITHRNGEVVADALERDADAVSAVGPIEVDPRRAPSPGAALSAFLRDYRAALEAEEAQVVDAGMIDGRRVAWLQFEAPSGQVEQVAVDEQTGRPLRLRTLSSTGPRLGHEWDVVSIATIPRAEEMFSEPGPLPAHPSAGSVRQSREASAAEASAELGRSVLWPGRVVEGLELVSLRIQVLARTYPDGTTELGRGVELIYAAADSSGRYLRLQQSPRPEPAYRFTEGRLTFNFNPIPPEGFVDLAAHGDAILGQLRADGVFLTLEASERSVLLSAAANMRVL